MAMPDAHRRGTASNSGAFLRRGWRIASDIDRGM